MLEPLDGADEVLDYIRMQAQQGAEQAHALLEATLALVLAPPVRLSAAQLEQVQAAAYMHCQYLTLLRTTVTLECTQVHDDDEEY